MALIKMTYITRAVEIAGFEKKNKFLNKNTENKPKTAASSKISESNTSVENTVLNQENTLETPPQLESSSSKSGAPEIPPTIVSEPEPAPGPAVSTIKSVPASMVSMPRIGSIDSLAQLIEEEEAILKQAVSKLTYENLVESWKKYAESHESPSTKTALASAKLDLIESKVVARVGSELAKGFIQQEFRLSDFLRFDLNEPELTLEIQMDASLAPEELKTQPQKKFLTPRDKLKLMMEVNPLVKDLAFKLNLKPDE
jgi:hypothetical protein